MAELNRREQIHAEEEFDVVGLVGQERSGEIDARIVDQHIDRAGIRFDPVNQAEYLVSIP